jgi:hypothetical protein
LLVGFAFRFADRRETEREAASMNLLGARCHRGSRLAEGVGMKVAQRFG